MRSKYLTPILGGLAALAVVSVIFWLFFGLWLDTDARLWQWLTESFWGRGLWPNGWNVLGANPWTYLLAGLAVAGVAVALWPSHDYYGKRQEGDSGASAFVATALSVLMIVSSVGVWFASVDDKSQSYASGTRFVVPDKGQLSTNLSYLQNRYVTEGTFSQAWDARVASARGAKTVMKRTSSSDSGNQLLLDTLTYTYGETQGWTAIRDGKRKQPLYGVAFWPGEGNVETCRFTGKYAMRKALHGKLGQSLLDEIADYNKSLFFDEQDMWGYCDGKRPVIVIPVKTWNGYGHRATWYSAGVLTVTGSSSGKAQIRHIKNATSAQFPGPVYPVSLAASQREETQWMAGIWNNWFRDFGYETTDVHSQAGNTSEFLLKSKKDGHLYWVTPLTARASDSQLVTAYSLIRADKANKGTFNALRIYVLASDDPRAVNLDDLEARTRQAISDENPGFFSAKGKLVEFLPLDDKSWQVYAELGGRVVYRITVPTDSRIRPQVTSLENFDETPSKDGTNSPNQGGNATSCNSDLNKLSNPELVSCLSDVANEMKSRQK